MLRFAVFDADGPARELNLAHAYAIDKQGDAIPSTIAFADGVISVRPAVNEPAAFALSRPVGAAGTLTLQTTPLPRRERPYLLDLELARHRVMLLIVKLEEWGLAPLLPAGHPVLRDLDEARDLMTAALCEPSASPGRYTPAQARIAAAAVERAVLASERLAMLHAERRLADRIGAAPPDDGLPRHALLSTAPLERVEDPDVDAEAHAAAHEDADPDRTRAAPATDLPKPLVGCLLHNERFAPPLQNIVKQTFDFVTSPLRWNEIEREEGRFEFRPSDRWIEWAVRGANLPVVAGPIVDLHPRAIPDWLAIWEHDYETLREFAFEHVARVVKRYRRAVRRWIAISAPTVNSGVRLSLDQWVDLARLTTLAVRKSAPGASVSVEIAAPFGQHPGGSEALVSPRFLAEMFLNAGVQFDSLALRIQLGTPEVGYSARDLMQIAAILDEYAYFEHLIDVSVLGMPSEEPPTRSPHLKPGCWHGPCTPARQAEFASKAVALIGAHPVVRSVAWQALYDTNNRPEQPLGGLITASGKAKPTLMAINSAAKSIRSGKIPTHPAAETVETEAPAQV